MRPSFIHALAALLGIVGAACSSSVNNGSGTGTHPDAGGNPPPANCSGTPQPLVGSCITMAGGNSILDCIEFTGSSFSQAAVNSGCSGTGLMASTSACPAMSQVGGSCIEHCGASDEDVVYYYMGSGLASMDAQNACAKDNGYWRP
jgi:hypothetical protein